MAASGGVAPVPPKRPTIIRPSNTAESLAGPQVPVRPAPPLPSQRPQHPQPPPPPSRPSAPSVKPVTFPPERPTDNTRNASVRK
ncbi:hypothetical protein ACF0H5_010232 [Mactra antiquata]